MPSSLDRSPALAAFLAGEDSRWRSLQLQPDEFLDLCEVEGLHALAYHRLSQSEAAGEWPEAVRTVLSREARRQAAAELSRTHEIRAVLAALFDEGVSPVLFKGAALAHTVYPTPASRQRNDTDLLIRAEDVDAARRVLTACGYATTVHCSDLFSQFEVQKEDGLGVEHVFDVHWKVSTQPVFADVLRFDHLAGRSQAVPALGPHARAAGPVDALLVACVHPVMHHRGDERALWIYDVHLLASLLTAAELDEVVELARQRKIAMVCAHALRRAQMIFGTPVSTACLSRMASCEPEPSAEYLAGNRRWHDELASSVRGVPTLSGRLRLLRQVLFPSPHYMLGAYRLSGKPLGSLLLPALYLHRNARGAWKILSGKK